MPVMDAGPIATIPIALAIMYLSAIGRIDPLFFITMIFCIGVVVLTVVFLVSSIRNMIKCKNGEMPLFGRNVFCLVIIPVLYSLIIAIFGMVYSVRAIALVAGGFLVILATFAISLIFIIACSFDRRSVSGLSLVALILAIVCLAVICVGVFQPIFEVETPNGFDGIATFEFAVRDFEDFYVSRNVERYYKNIAEKGAAKVMADAARRVQNSGNRGEALANVMMVSLPMAVPISMLISIMVIALSAAAIFILLLSKLCTARGKVGLLAISKAALLISSATFVWSVSEIASAIAEIGSTLEPLYGLTFSLATFPVIVVAASVILLLLGIRVKKQDA